jgi:hypothetical protein
VGLTSDRSLQHLGNLADREARRRVARLAEVFEVAMGMTGLAFGGVAEESGDLRIAFDISMLRKIQVTAVGLGFAANASFRCCSVLEPLSCAICADASERIDVVSSSGRIRV